MQRFPKRSPSKGLIALEQFGSCLLHEWDPELEAVLGTETKGALNWL